MRGFSFGTLTFYAYTVLRLKEKSQNTHSMQFNKRFKGKRGETG